MNNSDTEQKVSARRSTIDEWTAALAESTGSPGGGAASGVMLAIVYGLTSMVAGYTNVEGELARQCDELRRRALDGRESALQLADQDAAASESFGSAFRLQRGGQRQAAIRDASIEAANASAELGAQGEQALGDLEWLAKHGNPALIADVAVACGALRAAIAGARANVNFDLVSVTSSGESLEEVRGRHPQLWATVQDLDVVLDRIDRLTEEIEGRERLNPAG